MCEKFLKYVRFGQHHYFEDHMLTEIDLHYLWHYTSVDSFIKIVNGKQLRFTDCLFLNDIGEFNYIFQVLKEYVKTRRKHADYVEYLTGIIDSDNYDFVPSLNKTKNGYKFTSGRYYILSGSSDSDSLPLWTYYSKTGKYDGYSLKIDISRVFHNFKKYEQGTIYAGKVEYNLHNQIEIIENTIDAIVSFNEGQIKKLDKNSLSEEEYFYQLNMLKDESDAEALDFLNACRLFFKNSKFAFESELRIAVLVSLEEINGNKCNAAFTSVNGVIKPSIGLSIESEFPIVSLNVGPMIDKKLAIMGIKRLFDGADLKIDKDFVIEKSKINIRY